MKRAIIFLSVCLLACSSQNTFSQKKYEKTSFQTSNEWKPGIDVGGDVAIVYGTRERKGMSFEQRVESWRSRGYTVHFMTGIAWGDYQDYFTGKWDGKNHMDEGQVDAKGDTLWHHKSVPYIVPTSSFIEYIKQKQIKRAIDAGIDAIYLEEPEFWARAGYSKAFRAAWRNHYGFDWRPPHESPENTYLSNKLKYRMYYDALNEAFSFAKEYGRTKGMNVRCYVPTHSLVNYSSWRIVSPEASLASLPSVDGYIAQVWTGTAREATYYNGTIKERVFENAYLEYGSMKSMTAPTGRKMFFLTDPIEDRPKDWEDYKSNYEATFAAQLLYPDISNYEIMPWPERIYEGLYLNPSTGKKERIPKHYSTQVQIMVNTLSQMPSTADSDGNTSGISVLMANSLMFQRYPTHQGYEDPQLSNFYGLALPLLKRGIPVQTVHIENLSYPESLEKTKLLLMTYSNMKPLDQKAHSLLARWVELGGVLVYCGRDNDPFQSVTEWWNNGPVKYQAPSHHLFQLLGLNDKEYEGLHRFGKGWVRIIKQDPKEFVMSAGGDKAFFEEINELHNSKANAGIIKTKNYLHLSRGPFEIAAVMDESVSKNPLILNGSFINLFDPELPVLDILEVKPGEQAFLYNLKERQKSKVPAVVASAGRILDEKHEPGKYSFTVKAPLNSVNSMRVYLPSKPLGVRFSDASGNSLSGTTYEWNEKSNTCLLKFDNNPEGVYVSIDWQ